ncbi:MAG: sigma-54 dependent transcriptional regulator [Bdellovibrionaceae bacterium]|nr:sigma-54 dependent transcriptional regulator [Pseudobdellovibrionaceae bacterium]
MPCIVVIDDENEMLKLLSDHLRQENHQVYPFRSPVEALQKILSHDILPDLVITDLQMPDLPGLELIKRLKQKDSTLPIIVITAFGSIQSAVDAIRRGAFDYMTKPFKLSELSLIVHRALEVGRLARENMILREELKKQSSKTLLLGKSKPMRDLMNLIERISGANSNVLITGESGTGKEIVAKTIHQLSPRRDKPFVAINCTAIPETLLESELFGFAKGSFTGADRRKLGLFEEAQGGTLFLDEIGDMELGLQAKLLRVLQEKKIRPIGDTKDVEIDVRVIAATHKDLRKAIREGLFREDLYYRLNVIPILLPPLRHRKEDIPLLAQHFLQKYASLNQSPAREFSPSALVLLSNMPWPGNVRELENLVERLVVLAQGPVITEADIPQPDREEPQSFLAQIAHQLPTLDEVEKQYIQFVLAKTGGKKDQAAQILGINRRTLYRKEREYGWITEDSETTFLEH